MIFYSILNTFLCQRVNTENARTHFPLGDQLRRICHFINKWDYETTSDPYNLHHTPHPSMTPQPCLVITVMVYSFLVGAPQQQHRPARALYVPLPGWHPRWWPEYHACIETSPKTVTAVHVRLFIMRCGGCVAQVWKWHQSDVHGWHHSDSVSMNVCTCVCILYV